MFAVTGTKGKVADEKKPGQLRLGLNPPKEEVEETGTSIGTVMLRSKKICIMKMNFIIRNSDAF